MLKVYRYTLQVLQASGTHLLLIVMTVMSQLSSMDVPLYCLHTAEEEALCELPQP